MSLKMFGISLLLEWWRKLLVRCLCLFALFLYHFFFVVKALQKDKQVVCVENLPSKTKNVKNSN